MKRREVLKGAALSGLASLLGPAVLRGGEEPRQQRPAKVLVAGAHPDDPETACGGTVRLLVEAGHQVEIFYLTRGEAGVPGRTPEEAARLRTREAEEACAILGARPLFGTQVDGATELNRDRYREILDLVAARRPDVVFTHWPIDTHPDHRVCGLLFYHAWLNSPWRFDLYYHEVQTGHQTQNFAPTLYVDISPVVAVKHRACFVHRSQKVEEEYERFHGLMERFRGMQVYAEAAEAFVRQLPGQPETVLGNFGRLVKQTEGIGK